MRRSLMTLLVALAITTQFRPPLAFASGPDEDSDSTASHECPEPEPPTGVSEDDMEAISRALDLDRPSEEELPEPAAPALAPPPSPRPALSLASMNPEMALILNFSFAAFSGEPRQTGAHDPIQTGFNFQQLELSATSSVDPFFRLDTFVVFSLYGVEVEEAYGTTLALPFSLQARFGQFLTRVGRVNPTHPHEWLFEDQPLVLGKLFGGENNRGLGVELSWLAPLPWYVEAIWSLTDGRGSSTARSFWGADPLEVSSPLDFQNLLAIRQFFPLSHDWSLMIGATGITGPNPTGPRNRTDIYAGDVYLRWRPISTARGDRHVVLQAEVFNRRRQLPGELLVDWGGYAQALWRFAPRWETGLRSELVGGVADDPLDPAWTEARHRHGAVLSFRPTEFSRLRLQAARDDAAWFDRPTYSLFIAAELGIGAHAAHPF